MRLVDIKKLSELQNNPSNIRNICIMAHVDHGKTTLADSLVASNGIISPRMAGKLRYMDSRKDEQERGITMKSSSIALYYNTGENEYLVNLIDSPGHVDFSTEVSTAVRLCDGAILVVDVVEGVCAQTKVAIKQAWIENIHPVLVLNKIDRLITEVQLTPLDAYFHLTQVLEQINAVIGELFSTEVLGKVAVEEKKVEDTRDINATLSVSDWSAGLEESDDENLYFCPENGNVVFASAADGWGFGVKDFAKVLSEKLGMSEAVLNKTLWGDFYYNSKTKRIMKGAQEKAKKPLFVQMVLENLWSVYDTIVTRKDKEKLQKIVETLNLKMTTRDLRHTDPKVQLQAFCSQWLPLAQSVLDMCCARLPSPREISEEKVEKLLCSSSQQFSSLPSETQKLKESFQACSGNDDDPVLVFISKMFPVSRTSLPENRAKPLTQEEIGLRRELARQRHAERMKAAQEDTVAPTQDGCVPLPVNFETKVAPEAQEKTEESEDAFVAFARVFSGRIKKGQELFVLLPKHNPAAALEKARRGIEIDPRKTLKDLRSGEHVMRVSVAQLYLLMGRELEALDEIPAGNIVGIGGLEEYVLKSATLSSTLASTAFSELPSVVTPILRVAVEPSHPADMNALVRGLRLLNQADACVQVLVQETGEHVIVTAGEVHLQRCLDDLRERYAKVAINVSAPIVPFRETIVPPPQVDAVKEAILESSKEDEDQGIITSTCPSQVSSITIKAVPLPPEVTSLLEKNAELVKIVDRFVSSQRSQSESISQLNSDIASLNLESRADSIKLETRTDSIKLESRDVQEIDEKNVTLTERTLKAIADFKRELKEAFQQGGEFWEGAVEQIWSFGPRRVGPNILLNRIPNRKFSVWDAQRSDTENEFLKLENSFTNGFQLATVAGPLCEEPMMGVCFVVLDWTLDSYGDQSNQTFGPISGQIMSCVKEGCRKAFQAQPQRLMAAMYSCNILVTAEVLGRMHRVLAQRHGRILAGDLTEGSATFSVTAVLPVVESFQLAADLRKQTSGLASPQLVFSHWEVIDGDPYWAPSTEEEYLHFGEKGDYAPASRARRYVDAVRRRKGLHVDAKLVERAEKQRTLSKNK